MSTKVKICGLTCLEDADSVIESGADYAGMVVFFEKSKRCISVGKAQELVDYIRRRSDIIPVAVTVSPDICEVKSLLHAGFKHIQIHGQLSGDILKDNELWENGLKVIRAYNTISEDTSDEIKVLKTYAFVELFLFDAGSPGSGCTFDWNSIPPADILGKPFILAGGLTPDNVRYAIESVHPFGVDVSSGVENGKVLTSEEIKNGISMKSREKMLRFVSEALKTGRE